MSISLLYIVLHLTYNNFNNKSQRNGKTSADDRGMNVILAAAANDISLIDLLMRGFHKDYIMCTRLGSTAIIVTSPAKCSSLPIIFKLESDSILSQSKPK